MFAKPINMILVYIVTIFNVMILASPIVAVVAPLLEIRDNTIIIEYDTFQKIKLAFFLMAFLVSSMMLFYLILDFLFGLSLRSSLKNCQRFEKNKDYDFLANIFDQVKDKFNEKRVKLYIKNSNEINAFAVSSLGGKAIVLTSGLINHYLKYCTDSKQFLYALRSIMGHEMSHLINKDFLPSFLIISNQKVTNFSSSLLYSAFKMTSRIMGSIPYGGKFASHTMDKTYSALNLLITFFNRFVVYSVYEFLRKFISRSIEYRCDNQSAKAFGGGNMAFALSMLGDSGYFTLFSTHPRTKARVKKVQDIKISDKIIRPKFFDSLANYLSLLFLVVICAYFAKQARIDVMAHEFIKNHEIIHRKISTLWNLISKFF